jgi:DivIVA domain-containing protein
VPLDRLSIEKRDFPLSRRGYDPGAVDAHLRELADRFEAEGSRPQTLASAAGEQVQSIVAAAESSAADIRREAEAAGRATAEEVTSDAERLRVQATRKAQEYVATVRDATGGMVERVQALEAELKELVGSVRSNGERLRGDLTQLTHEVGELSATSATWASGESAKPPPPASSTDGGDSLEGAAPAGVTTDANQASLAPDAPGPEPAVGGDEHTGTPLRLS